MKKSLVLAAFCLTFITSRSQDIRVEGDRRLNTDISDLNTFSYASQVDNTLDPGFHFLNDMILKAAVRNAVESELVGLGYEKVQGSADMLVNFRVFDKPATIKGFEGLGTDYWTKDEVRDPDTRTEYKVEAGTLMIHLVEAESGHVIWQGFASGLIDDGKFIKDEGKIREAVNMIFDEFGQRANEYTRK